MKTFVKSALAAVSACAIFVSAGAFAGHHMHKKANCVKNAKSGTTTCVHEKHYVKGGMLHKVHTVKVHSVSKK